MTNNTAMTFEDFWGSLGTDELPLGTPIEVVRELYSQYLEQRSYEQIIPTHENELVASYNYTLDGFHFFDVRDLEGHYVAGVALWGDYLETTEGWCELDHDLAAALEAAGWDGREDMYLAIHAACELAFEGLEA